MGFDISGLASTDVDGEYFRNNVWWWRPLATVIEEVCSDLLTEEQKKGLHCNSGVKYSKETAIKIAERLEEEIKTEWKIKATAKQIQDNYSFKSSDGKQKFEYSFSIANVKNFINFAKKSGGFEIW